MARMNLDPTMAKETEASSGFEPLPAGRYVAKIIESEMKISQSGGEYLKLTYEIIDGQYRNRRVWQNLNLVNKNEKAVQIAYQNLAAITDTLKLPRVIDDSQALHGKPLIISVKVRTDDRGNPQNDVNGYMEYVSGGVPSSNPIAPATAQVAQQQAANGAPAWAGNSNPWAKPQ